jgi:hypothetical protein
LVPLLLSPNGNLCVELTDGTDDEEALGWPSYDSTLEDVGPLWDALDEQLVGSVAHSITDALLETFGPAEHCVILQSVATAIYAARTLDWWSGGDCNRLVSLIPPGAQPCFTALAPPRFVIFGVPR